MGNGLRKAALRKLPEEAAEEQLPQTPRRIEEIEREAPMEGKPVSEQDWAKVLWGPEDVRDVPLAWAVSKEPTQATMGRLRVATTFLKPPPGERATEAEWMERFNQAQGRPHVDIDPERTELTSYTVPDQLEPSNKWTMSYQPLATAQQAPRRWTRRPQARRAALMQAGKEAEQ